jgi:excisionase family DNA binding protein
MSDPIIPTDLISPNEAAKLLGRSPTSIRRWIAVGMIPGFKIGGQLALSKADVLAMVKQVVPDNNAPRPLTKAEFAAKEAEVDRVLREARIRR